MTDMSTLQGLENLLRASGHLRDGEAIHAMPHEKFVPDDSRMGYYAENESVLAISIQSCGLTKMPESIGDLTNLRELSLSGNQLVSLPDSFWKLTTLQTLSLAENQLVGLPDAIGYLKH